MLIFSDFKFIYYYKTILFKQSQTVSIFKQSQWHSKIYLCYLECCRGELWGLTKCCPARKCLGWLYKLGNVKKYLISSIFIFRMHFSMFLLFIKYDQSYIFISSRYNNIVVTRLDQSTVRDERTPKFSPVK